MASKEQRKAAIQAHRKARENLAEVSAKTNDADNGEYLAANRAVIEAEKNIPWWRR